MPCKGELGGQSGGEGGVEPSTSQSQGPLTPSGLSADVDPAVLQRLLLVDVLLRRRRLPGGEDVCGNQVSLNLRSVCSFAGGENCSGAVCSSLHPISSAGRSHDSSLRPLQPPPLPPTRLHQHHYPLPHDNVGSGLAAVRGGSGHALLPIHLRVRLFVSSTQERNPHDLCARLTFPVPRRQAYQSWKFDSWKLEKTIMFSKLKKS